MINSIIRVVPIVEVGRRKENSAQEKVKRERIKEKRKEKGREEYKKARRQSVKQGGKRGGGGPWSSKVKPPRPDWPSRPVTPVLNPPAAAFLPFPAAACLLC